jgi:histone H3/H4
VNVDAYELRGEWAAATEQVMRMMLTGIAPDPDLPEGPSSSTGVENYARTLCQENPRADLGIMYGLASVAVCVAVQGGIIAQTPIAGGGWLTVPAVQQFIGVAPSGWRKSTALGAVSGPLDRALESGVRTRRRMVADLLAAEKQRLRDENVGAPDFLLNDKQLNEVFSGGICSDTLAKDPTVESLRNMAVHNGGCVGVLAGEADVFRNISAYSNDPGSLTFFLDLWDQSKIATARVGAGMLQMDDAALYLGVLFQTDVFAEITSGSGGRGGAGADSFLLRGMFGRILVVQTDSVGGFEQTAAAYADHVVHDNAGPDGLTAPDGLPTALGLATADFESTLTKLVNETSQYRMYKGLAQSWASASRRHGTDLQVAEITAQPREEIFLDALAQQAYNRCQRMYNALEGALAEMDEDANVMWGPLVARYVQHTMREALVIALSAGRRQITATDITDAATRLVPWRWALTTRALSKRQHDRVADILAMAAVENRNMDDRTPEGRVMAALSRMAKDDPQAREDGYTLEQVTYRLTSVMNSRQARRNVKMVVEQALMNLASNPLSGVKRKYVREGSATVTKFVIDENAIIYT